jgi:WD40 repeat protein
LILSLVTTPNNKYLISGSGDRSIAIFDLQTKQKVNHFADVHEGKKSPPFLIVNLGYIYCLAISSDSKYLLSGSEDRSILVIDLEARAVLHQFKNAHEGKFH